MGTLGPLCPMRFPCYHHCRGQERNAAYEAGCTLWLVGIGDNVRIRVFLQIVYYLGFHWLPCWRLIETVRLQH